MNRRRGEQNSSRREVNLLVYTSKQGYQPLLHGNTAMNTGTVALAAAV
jgi:hypothetical protein